MVKGRGTRWKSTVLQVEENPFFDGKKGKQIRKKPVKKRKNQSRLFPAVFSILQEVKDWQSFC
jgi:hypothetical protein